MAVDRGVGTPSEGVPGELPQWEREARLQRVRTEGAAELPVEVVELAAHYRYQRRPVASTRGNEKGRVQRTIPSIQVAALSAQAGEQDNQGKAHDSWT